MREAVEHVAEIEQADERNNVGRDRGARNHQIDDTELDGIDDVDFLTELVVREEIDLDLLAEAFQLQVLDEGIVGDAPTAEFWIIRQRTRHAEFERSGHCAADQCGRRDNAQSGRSGKFKEWATGYEMHHVTVSSIRGCTALV